MTKYKVIAGACVGNGDRKILEFGEIVTQNDLIDPVEELIKRGFIAVHEEAAPVASLDNFDSELIEELKSKLKLAVDENVELKTLLTEAKALIEELKLKVEGPGENETEKEESSSEEKEEVKDVLKVEVPEDFNDTTRKAIVKDLQDWGIVFDPTKPKAELYKLWKPENEKRK